MTAILRTRWPAAVRAALLPLLAVALFACGGGDAPSGTVDPPTPPPPTPPPIATSTPATIRLQAGDQQTTDPGARVDITPVVQVLDSAGRPVAGVTVRFVVDSGGGAVDSASVITSATGVASAGGWRLGPIEGAPQRLQALVGALTPAVFRATARVAAITLAEQSLPTNDQPLVFHRPGLPGDGVMLAASTGAFGAASRVSLRVESSQRVILPSGWRAISPAIRVLPVNGVHREPFTLAIPGEVNASDPVVLVAWDEATGRLAVLPTVGRSDRVLAALVSPASTLTWYAPSSVGAATTAAARAGAVRSVATAPNTTDPAGDPPVMLMVRIDPSMLNLMYDTGFRPERDAWPFDDIVPVLAPTFGSAELAVRELFVAPAVSAIWYYLYQRAGGALRTRFTEAANIVGSTRFGFKWNAGIENLLPPTTLPRVVRLREQLTFGVPQVALQQYWGVVALFGLSRNAPQPVALMDDASATDETIAKVGIAFRTQRPTPGSAELLLDVAVPGSNEGVVTMRARADGWVPVTITYGRARRPLTITGLNVLPAGGGFADVVLSSTWPLVEQKVFGTTPEWPRLRLTSAFGELDPADVVLLDTLQHWWECENCPPTTYAQRAVVPHPPRLRPFSRYSLSGTVWTAREGLVPSLRFSSSALPAAADTVVNGMVVWQPGEGSSDEIAQNVAWIDWRTITYRRMRTTIAPAGEVTASRDTTIRFSVTGDRVPAGRLRYRWIVRASDGTGGDSVETNDPNWSRTFSNGTERWVIATILQGDGKRPIGRDSVKVSVVDFAAWRLEQFDATVISCTREQARLCDQPWLGIDRLPAQPALGVLRVFRTARAVFGWPTPPASEGMYPTPSVWLDAPRDWMIAQPTAVPDRWQPQQLNTIAVAHAFSGTLPGGCPGVINGALQFSGTLTSGSVTGWARPLAEACFNTEDTRYDVRLTFDGNMVHGTLERRVVTLLPRTGEGTISAGTVIRHVRYTLRGRRIPTSAAQP